MIVLKHPIIDKEDIAFLRKAIGGMKFNTWAIISNETVITFIEQSEDVLI